MSGYLRVYFYIDCEKADWPKVDETLLKMVEYNEVGIMACITERIEDTPEIFSDLYDQWKAEDGRPTTNS
jgi:hypothetical protein